MNHWILFLITACLIPVKQSPVNKKIIIILENLEKSSLSELLRDFLAPLENRSPESPCTFHKGKEWPDKTRLSAGPRGSFYPSCSPESTRHFMLISLWLIFTWICPVLWLAELGLLLLVYFRKRNVGMLLLSRALLPDGHRCQGLPAGLWPAGAAAFPLGAAAVGRRAHAESAAQVPKKEGCE